MVKWICCIILIYLIRVNSSPQQRRQNITFAMPNATHIQCQSDPFHEFSHRSHVSLSNESILTYCDRKTKDINRSDDGSFSFYVMGDTPYNKNEAELLSKQLTNLDKDALFIVHVGDLMNKSSSCSISQYRETSNILRNSSSVPVLVLPGDNDWIDCYDSNLAMRRFKRYFISRLNSSFDFTILSRQNQRSENFFFRFKDVLFFGLNVSSIGVLFFIMLSLLPSFSFILKYSLIFILSCSYLEKRIMIGLRDIGKI